MTDYLKKLAAAGFLSFLLLWAVGVARTYTLPRPEVQGVSSPILSSIEEYRASLQTANNLRQIGLALAALPHLLDRADVKDVQRIVVYERTAQLATSTAAFDSDEGRVREAVGTHKAAIFGERATGIPPARTLTLGISVPPDSFDSLLHDLSSIGQVRSVVVEQHDRTGEFRRLHAQRQSLRKHQEAILKLRGAANMSVEEALKVEQRAQELEKEIQALGVRLGDLLGKEPSYNLFVTLQEYQPGGRHDPGFMLTRRLGGGFLWALGWWALGVLGVSLILGTYLSVRTLRPARTPVASAAGVSR